MRAAIYGRHSSSKQSATSSEDQDRICREFALKQGWTVVASYSDPEISGASMMRPGLQKMLTASGEGAFDVIVAEALDRVSRDLQDIAGIFKRLFYNNVKLFTLSEGEITPLHVGLKGTMNALFLKDLADKTRRGMRGRMEAGKAVAGIAYGYKSAVVGEREIVETEAEIVRRIFAEYNAGRSPRQISISLNKDGVPGPSLGTWGPSTILGNRLRGNGILNNEIYIGRMVWNRQHFVKDPDSGKRQSRMNPPEQWLFKDVPLLRIVDDETWKATKARQGDYAHTPLESRRRAKHLLSGLVACGCCGKGMSAVGADVLGCTNARDRGTCDNRKTVKRGQVEERILAALQGQLLREDLFAEFCAEYTREFNRLNMERRTSERGLEAELVKVTNRLDKLIDALAEGTALARIKEEMQKLDDRRNELLVLVERAKAPTPYLHPKMADVYRRHVANLRAGLKRDGDSAPSTATQNALRALIQRVVITPADDGVSIDLIGDLAGILRAASGKNEMPAISDGHSVKMVAGTGFEPVTFRL